MKYLLDTHTWIWWYMHPQKLRMAPAMRPLASAGVDGVIILTRDIHKFKSLFGSQLKPHLFYDSFPSSNRQTHIGLGDADFPCKA